MGENRLGREPGEPLPPREAQVQAAGAEAFAEDIAGEAATEHVDDKGLMSTMEATDEQVAGDTEAAVDPVGEVRDADVLERAS